MWIGTRMRKRERERMVRRREWLVVSPDVYAGEFT